MTTMLNGALKMNVVLLKIKANRLPRLEELSYIVGCFNCFTGMISSHKTVLNR